MSEDRDHPHLLTIRLTSGTSRREEPPCSVLCDTQVNGVVVDSQWRQTKGSIKHLPTFMLPVLLVRAVHFGTCCRRSVQVFCFFSAHSQEVTRPCRRCLACVLASSCQRHRAHHPPLPSSSSASPNPSSSLSRFPRRLTWVSDSRQFHQFRVAEFSRDIEFVPLFSHSLSPSIGGIHSSFPPLLFQAKPLCFLQ